MSALARKKEPRTRLDVDERRAQLVALGLEHFGKAPYDEVSIDAIAHAAGISKGLLYHYFPTKKEFYAATVREAAARLLALTETPADAPALERLRAGLDAYLDFVREHAAAYATLMKSGVGADPTIARVVDETRERFVARLTDGIRLATGETGETGETLPRTPLLDLALRGWVGLAEAVCLGWTEAIAKAAKASAPGASAPPQSQVRDLLANALMAILGGVA